MKQVSVKKALQAWQGIQPISDKDRERLSRSVHHRLQLQQQPYRG